MKVGLCTLDMPATLGGGYVLRDDMARFATNFGGPHQFELVTIPAEEARWPRPKWKFWGASPFPGPASHQRFRDEVKARKFDLLWFNHLNPIYIDVPYVLNIFDIQHRLQPWFPEVSANGQWEQREAVLKEGIQRAAIITVGSQEAKEQLCHFYGIPLDNVSVLPFPTPQKAQDIANGKISVAETEDVRAKYGIKHDFLFYPAQLWSHKNHVNLFHALKLLKENGRAISLVLTGADHGNRHHLEATVAALGLGDLVHFCGFVPYEDILAFYRQARALSYVSFFGPENLPPLEAMALECPVVLADIAGARALHNDSPIMVNPRDPKSIADGIAYVLDHPDQIRERIRIGKEAALRNTYERYLESFQTMLDTFEPMRRCWP